MTNKNTHENKTFRILSAIGIICVVMGHLQCQILNFDPWLPYYSFHMPLFAFVSGYFYSIENDKKPLGFICKKSKTILLPFYLISLFYLLVQMVLHARGKTSYGMEFSLYNWLIRPFVKTQPLGYNIATWYMISLFILEVIYVIIRWTLSWCKKGQHKDSILLIIYGLCGAIIISHGAYPEEWQKVVYRSIFLLFFYHVGFYYHKYIEGKIIIRERRIRTGFIMLFLLITRALLINQYGKCDYEVWNCDFHGYSWFVVYLQTAIGILFWLIFSKTITPAIKDNGLMVKIGKHTREVMCHHLFAVFLIQGIIYKIYQLLNIKSSFDIEAYKSKLYYVFEPWKGFNLVLTVFSIGLVLLMVNSRERMVVWFKNATKRTENSYRE